MVGLRIDLLVEGIQSRLAVECDSDVWHGEEAFDREAYQERMLERCGTGFVHVRGSAFEHGPEAALEPLWAELQAHGISARPHVPPAGIRLAPELADRLSSERHQRVGADWRWRRSCPVLRTTRRARSFEKTSRTI